MVYISFNQVFHGDDGNIVSLSFSLVRPRFFFISSLTNQLIYVLGFPYDTLIQARLVIALFGQYQDMGFSQVYITPIKVYQTTN